MATSPHTRKMPREKLDTSDMRPDLKREHEAQIARAEAMNTRGIPPKTTVKARY